MKTAVERAAERWGMKEEIEKERTAPEEPLVNTQGRDAVTGLTDWGERPQPNEPFVRSDTHEIREPERDE